MVALLLLMLIMENWSLGLLSASFLVISLVLKVLNCGILKPRRLLLAETLSLMNLLCYMMFHLLMFLLRVNSRLLFSILLFRWSMLLIRGDTSGNEIFDAHDEPVVDDEHVTPTPNQPIVPPGWNLARDRVR